MQKTKPFQNGPRKNTSCTAQYHIKEEKKKNRQKKNNFAYFIS